MIKDPKSGTMLSKVDTLMLFIKYYRYRHNIVDRGMLNVPIISEKLVTMCILACVHTDSADFKAQLILVKSIYGNAI